MTGPEHYQKAERLLARVDLNSSYGDKARALIEQAQAHATLAVAAATAMHATVDGTELGVGEAAFQAWHDAAGVKPRSEATR